MELRPATFDGSLRSHVVGASTSVLTRLSLLSTAADDLDVPQALRAMIHHILEYTEQTLQELVTVFPEPAYDLQGKVAGNSGASAEPPKVSLDNVGVTGGNSKVLTTPAVLLDERDTIDEMQRSSDPATLKRCIALLRMQLVEAQVEVDSGAAHCAALVASHRRRCEGLDYARREMEREVLTLRRTALGQEPRITHDIFSTLDVLLLLGGGNARNAALTDDILLRRIEEALAIFRHSKDARQCFSDEAMQLSLDRIAEAESKRAAAEERVMNIGRKMQDNDERAKREMVAVERKQRELRQRISELEAKLQTDKAAWLALERELETVKADKEALIQAVTLAEAKTKQQRQELYVHIATLSQQLLVEQKKYTMSFEVDPDPLNVDLVQDIANSGIAKDLSEETLQRMLAATQRPDDPTKLAAQDNLADKCEHLAKDVRAWKSVALDAGLQLQIKSVEKTDLEEDLLRVIGYSKDNNLPVPLDLVKSRIEAEHINAFDDNTNFKEVCRTMRTDAKVASRRLHEIRYRMEGIVPLAARTARGDALANYDQQQQQKLSQEVEQNAQFARGAVSPVAPQSPVIPEQPRDELGTLLEEVELTERVETKMREVLLENAKTIRKLRVDLNALEKAKANERITWVDQWCNLLQQLPPTVSEQLNLDGLAALEVSPIIHDEFKRIKEEHKEAQEQEKQEFFRKCDKEKEKLQQIAQRIQDEKNELLEERKALAALDPGALAIQRKRSMAKLQAMEAAGTDDPDALVNDTSDVFDWKKGIEMVDQELQTERDVVDQETTTQDPILYHRQFKSKDMETVRRQMLERGAQVHVVGDDMEIQCDLGPKFDREAAEELFSELGHLFDKAERDKATEAVQSPPRCGSPAFPSRFLCPSCGESIAHVAAGIFGPERAIQTDATAEPTSPTIRRRSSHRPSPVQQLPDIFYAFEALRVDTLSEADVEFVQSQVSKVAEQHGGVVVKGISNTTNGVAVLCRFGSVVRAVECAMSLHEFQRAPHDMETSATLLSTSNPPTPHHDSARRLPAKIYFWPKCRGGIGWSAAASVELCGCAFPGETTCGGDDLLSDALTSQPLATQYSCLRRSVGESEGSAGGLWSIVPMLHADRRDDWKSLPSCGNTSARSMLLGSSGSPGPAADERRSSNFCFTEDDLVDAHEELVEVQDNSCQTEPMVVMSDEDFIALKRASQQTSRSNTPLAQSQRPSSNQSQRVKPSSAAIARRPSTAAMKKLEASLGVLVRNDAYADAVSHIWRGLDPFISEELRTAPQRAFSEEEMPLVGVLSELAAVLNVKGLLGLPESDAELAMRTHALTCLQLTFQELGLTDFTLPARIPFTVVVRQPGLGVVASAAQPVLSSTNITDAFRPILHLLSRATSVPSRSFAFMRPNTPLAVGATAPPMPPSESSDVRKPDVQAIHTKLRELEALVHDVVLGLEVPSTSAPSSPPLLLSQYLGWEGEAVRKPPSPILAEEPSPVCRRESPKRIGRVVVKPLHATVSIRKVAVLDDVSPLVVSAAQHAHSQAHSGKQLPGGRHLRPLPVSRRAMLADESSFLPHEDATASYVARRGDAPPSRNRHRVDSSLHRTLHGLPAQLPPIATIADVFAQTFGVPPGGRFLDSRGSMTSQTL